MNDINKRLADIRSEADASYQAAKNLQKDAGRLYSRADRLFGAKKAFEAVEAHLMSLGFPFEPHIIRQAIDAAQEDYEASDL